MIEHASQFAERGTSFMFDPGQGLPPVDGDDLCQVSMLPADQFPSACVTATLVSFALAGCDGNHVTWLWERLEGIRD